MAVADLSLELADVMRRNDDVWSQLLSMGSSVMDEDHQRILVTAASDVRAKLKRAMVYASDMFSTNMQCLAHILALKKENGILEMLNTQAAQESKGRMDSLLGIVESQQSQLDSMSKAISLKGMWSRMLIPHRREDDEEMNENCAIAMSWLSAQCAQDVFDGLNLLSSQKNSMSSSAISNFGQSGHASESVINHLLEKIGSLESLAGEEYNTLENENRQLRQQSQRKSIQMHLIESEESLVRNERERSEMWAEDSHARARNYLEKYTASSAEVVKLQFQVETLQHELNARTVEVRTLQAKCKQYLSVCHEWKLLCERQHQHHESSLYNGHANPRDSYPPVFDERVNQLDSNVFVDSVGLRSPATLSDRIFSASGGSSNISSLTPPSMGTHDAMSAAMGVPQSLQRFAQLERCDIMGDGTSGSRSSGRNSARPPCATRERGTLLPCSRSGVAETHENRPTDSATAEPALAAAAAAAAAGLLPVAISPYHRAHSLTEPTVSSAPEYARGNNICDIHDHHQDHDHIVSRPNGHMQHPHVPGASSARFTVEKMHWPAQHCELPHSTGDVPTRASSSSASASTSASGEYLRREEYYASNDRRLAGGERWADRGDDEGEEPRYSPFAVSVQSTASTGSTQLLPYNNNNIQTSDQRERGGYHHIHTHTPTHTLNSHTERTLPANGSQSQSHSQQRKPLRESHNERTHGSIHSAVNSTYSNPAVSRNSHAEICRDNQQQYFFASDNDGGWSDALLSSVPDRREGHRSGLPVTGTGSGIGPGARREDRLKQLEAEKALFYVPLVQKQQQWQSGLRDSSSSTPTSPHKRSGHRRTVFPLHSPSCPTSPSSPSSSSSQRTTQPGHTDQHQPGHNLPSYPHPQSSTQLQLDSQARYGYGHTETTVAAAAAAAIHSTRVSDVSNRASKEAQSYLFPMEEAAVPTLQRQEERDQARPHRDERRWATQQIPLQQDNPDEKQRRLQVLRPEVSVVTDSHNYHRYDGPSSVTLHSAPLSGSPHYNSSPSQYSRNSLKTALTPAIVMTGSISNRPSTVNTHFRDCQQSPPPPPPLPTSSPLSPTLVACYAGEQLPPARSSFCSSSSQDDFIHEVYLGESIENYRQQQQQHKHAHLTSQYFPSGYSSEKDAVLTRGVTDSGNHTGSDRCHAGQHSVNRPYSIVDEAGGTVMPLLSSAEGRDQVEWSVEDAASYALFALAGSGRGGSINTAAGSTTSSSRAALSAAGSTSSSRGARIAGDSHGDSSSHSSGRSGNHYVGIGVPDVITGRKEQVLSTRLPDFPAEQYAAGVSPTGFGRYTDRYANSSKNHGGVVINMVSPLSN